MNSKCVLQITESIAPNTGRETTAREKRNWESFPQPCGWSLHWDNEGLLRADPSEIGAEDVEQPSGAKRPDQS